MNIIWQKSNQHTPWGLLRVGEQYDLEAMGVPDAVIGAWKGDGFAVPLVRKSEELEASEEMPKAKRHISKTTGGQHGRY